PEGRDHRLARGRVRAALHLAREQDRLSGLRDPPGDSLADLFPIVPCGVGEAMGATHRELALGVGKHDRDAIGAEDLRELRRRPLEELSGIATPSVVWSGTRCANAFPRSAAAAPLPHATSPGRLWAT